MNRLVLTGDVMRFKMRSLIIFFVMIFMPVSGGHLCGADSGKTMEYVDGTVIEERTVPPSDSHIPDPDAANPGGETSAPVSGTPPQSAAAPVSETPLQSAEAPAVAPEVVEKEPAKNEIKIDEAMVEKIIPSYSFGMKKLVKNAEKEIEKINRELARREKLKAKDKNAK